LSGGERPSPPSRRSGAVKLGAACLGRCRGGWQAALTKPWRVGTARRRGCGERGGKAYARNRRLRLSKTHRLEPGGSGPEATRTCLPHYGGGELPECRRADGEAGVRCCGVATAMSQGSSRVPPPSSDQQVNTGTVPGPPPCLRLHRGQGGWAHRRPIGQGRGGAVVVVRGRESRSHGEGRQWFREEIGGCNAERRGTEW
jgi:hypothetical protein